MKSSSTSERLKQIMQERNLKQVDILEACQPYCKKYGVKLKKNDLSQYVSGKVTPKQNKLSILGMALNVNEVWLMGYDVPKERNKKMDINNDKNMILNQNEKTQKEFSNIFNKLSDALQEHLLKTAKDLLETQNKLSQTSTNELSSTSSTIETQAVSKAEEEYIKNVLYSVPSKNYSALNTTKDENQTNINYG